MNNKAKTTLPLPLMLPVLLLLLAACGSQNGGQSNTTPSLEKGEQVFSRYCSSCHATIPDTVIVGPPLAGIGETAAARVEGMDAQQYIKLSISQPDAYLVEGYPDVMPLTLADTLTEDEIDAIVEYLMTLE